MDLFSCDVLVVGGGGAGLRAAIAVAEGNPRLSVAVISKVYPMRSHTVSAEGGAAAVIKAGVEPAGGRGGLVPACRRDPGARGAAGTGAVLRAFGGIGSGAG
ncbi:MAG: FAD-binding protein, partial [Candidatus Rokubacteria bacterium]|nr:FAD-binding protein [Candidatus Rokubacteria bacterium]